jgi:hypothetical protein
VAFLTSDQIRHDLLEPLSAEVDDDTFEEIYSTLAHVLAHTRHHGYATHNAAERDDALPPAQRR